MIEAETEVQLKFPFDEPYKIQIYAQQILEERKKLTLLEMPTGTGKTVVMLVSLLSSDKQIMYFCQSHDQAKIVIDEIARINEINNTDYSVVHLAGRSKLCVASNLIELQIEEDRLNVCKKNRILNKKGVRDERNDNCSAKLEESHELQINDVKVLTHEVMNDLAVKIKKCPRSIMAYAVQHAKVLVMPYNYLANPLPSMPISDCMIIMDEAHNIDDKLIDLATVSFSSKQLMSLARWCKKHSSVAIWTNILEDRIIDLVDAIESLTEDIYTFDNNIRFKVIGDIYNILSSLEEESDEELGMERSQFPESLYRLQNSSLVFKKIVNSQKVWDHHLFVVDRDKNGNVTLRLRPLTPRFAFRRYVKNHHSVTMASGTLNIPRIKYTLRISPDEAISLPSIHTGAFGVHLSAINVNKEMISFTTLSKHRGVVMWENYAKLVKFVSKFTPQGMLLFAPSYKIADRIKNAIIKEKTEYYFVIFTDLQLYMEYMSNPEHHALFISSFRGKGSEGYNFPDHYARAIFLAGVPRPPPTRERQAQIEYYNKYSKETIMNKKLGQYYDASTTIVPVAQAFGRGMRHADDWCVTYLLDQRFSEYQNYFPKWVKDSILWDKQITWVDKIKACVNFVRERST